MASGNCLTGCCFKSSDAQPWSSHIVMDFSNQNKLMDGKLKGMKSNTGYVDNPYAFNDL